MKALAAVLVFFAWLIPGRPHRWACRLRAERRASYGRLGPRRMQ